MYGLTPRRSRRSYPFGAFPDVNRDFENIYDGFFGEDRFSSSRLVEKDSHYIAMVDMPGVSSKDIDILVEDGMVKIKASREEEGRSFDYSSSFMVPGDTKEKDIKAIYESGVLKIAIPKASKSDSKKIELSDSKENTSFFKKLFSNGNKERIDIDKTQ
jgi:HSP20 family molecular chaperone IbpA